MTKAVHQRLLAIGEELSRLRSEGSILAEQLVYLRDVMEESRVRALVAETPLAEREFRVATEDARRVERVLAEVEARQRALVAERDRLLEEPALSSRPGLSA